MEKKGIKQLGKTNEQKALSQQRQISTNYRLPIEFHGTMRMCIGAATDTGRPFGIIRRYQAASYNDRKICVALKKKQNSQKKADILHHLLLRHMTLTKPFAVSAALFILAHRLSFI